MTQTNAQVALLAAVQSINSGDIWQGKDFVKNEIEKRRYEYLSWLDIEDASRNPPPGPIDPSHTINVRKK